ncbi:hypothetical protein D3C85_1887760 [compost metagenome]
MQAQRRVGVFGNRLDGKAADRVQRAATQYRARAAEKRRVPHVVAVLNQPVEQLAFVGVLAEHIEVALEGVR